MGSCVGEARFGGLLFATWCGPCFGFEPHLKEVAGQYKALEQIDTYKVDVDQDGELTSLASVQYPHFCSQRKGYGSTLDARSDGKAGVRTTH